MPSTQPGIRPFKRNTAGSPRVSELSNILPSVVQPV